MKPFPVVTMSSPEKKKRRRRQPICFPSLTSVLGIAVVSLLLFAAAPSARFPIFHVNPKLSSNSSQKTTLSGTSPTNFNRTLSNATAPPPTPPTHPGPYHDWQLFAADFEEMMLKFKIFPYPDIFETNNSFSWVFLPHPNPFNPKLGNYFSEHMFKISLLRSSIITSDPRKAFFFFLPFSINNLRNDPRFRSEASIAKFVAQYVTNISRRFPFWNASTGADHFYAHCHSIGREAASMHLDLRMNGIQVTCSSNYFQRFYVTHKDIALPQIWPRPYLSVLSPPHRRDRLVFFSGRVQNSRVRQELLKVWGNDTSMDIFPKNPPFPYEEGFKRSKFCLHVKGYEVNTARISDAIHYGCIPVILSNYYDLPLSNVLNWTEFSIIIHSKDIGLLKKRLLSIGKKKYLNLYYNLCKVRKHFVWHEKPSGYDAFHMTAYHLWLRRSSYQRRSY